jgi:hypothetical protein
MDLAPVDGVLHGALGLVDVRAIGELAAGDVGAELDEVALDLAGLDVPELELAEAGGVDDVAPGVEPDQLGGGGGVLPLGGPVGDLADPEVQPRLDGVEQRALADAALAGERGGSPRKELAEPVDPPAVGGGGGDRLVAELGVEPDDPLVGGDVDQVGLVQDDDRPDAPLLGRDQVAVDQRQLQAGLGEGRDEQDLVDVRDDHMLATPIPAGDHPAPGVNLLDLSLIGAGRPEPDPVTDGHDVPALDRQRLEDTSDPATHLTAILGLDDRDQPVHAEDTARLTGR